MPSTTDTSTAIASFPRNAAAIVAFDALWALGTPCVLVNTILPAYLLYLGQSMTVVQAVMVGLSPLVLLEVLSGKLFHGRRRRIRQFQFWLVLPGAWLALGLVGLAAGDRLPAGVWTGLLIAVCAVNGLANHLGGPAYWEMTQDMTPLDRRGRLAGLRSLGVGLFGLGGAVLAAAILAKWTVPWNYHVCFIVGPVLMLCSCLAVLFMRDPGHPDDETPAPSVRAAVRALLRQREFLRFLGAFSCLAASQSLMPLLIGYGQAHAGLAEQGAGPFTLATFAGALTIGPAVPRLADRFGFRLIGLISAGLGALAWMVSLLAGGSGLTLLAAYALLAGAGSLGTYVLVNLGSELAPHVKPAMVVAVGTILIWPLSLAASPLSGWLVDALGLAGYRLAFTAGATFDLLALAGLALLVREPRPRRPI